MHPAQSAFIRYAWGFVLLSPFVIRHGVAVIHTRRLGSHVTRGLVHSGGVMLWFYAIAHLPLAEVMALGFTSTALLQSSSMTTSLAVPLAGAGFLTLQQVFPYALGANVGTTLTAMFAALMTGQEAAVTVAFAHLLYNVMGIALVWPLRRIPLGLAELLAKYALRSRLVPLGYVILVFFAVPMALIFLMR